MAADNPAGTNENTQLTGPAAKDVPARRVRVSVRKRGEQKSRWDKAGVILQALTVLAIPITIYFSVHEFGVQQASSAAQLTRQQMTAATQSRDEQHQSMLNSYFDDMSALMLSHGLSTTRATGAVRAIAVARTSTTARDLDGARKGILIRFLWEAGLISVPRPVLVLPRLGLQDANLSGASLGQVDLSAALLNDADFAGADAYGSNLSRADLAGADLRKVNLSCFPQSVLDVLARTVAGGTSGAVCASLAGASLTDANLSGADLLGADLSGARLTSVSLSGAQYNSRPLTVVLASGRSVTVRPTLWPEGYRVKTGGAVCVDC